MKKCFCFQAMSHESDRLVLLKIEFLKRQGDSAFDRANYREAAKSYTDALEIENSSRTQGHAGVSTAKSKIKDLLPKILSNRCMCLCQLSRYEQAAEDSRLLLQVRAEMFDTLCVI